jgi:hypothetical protein
MTDSTVTRATGSWVADGYTVGRYVVFAAPWHRRLWWWVLRALRIRRRAGTYAITSVTPTVLRIEEP